MVDFRGPRDACARQYDWSEAQQRVVGSALGEMLQGFYAISPMDEPPPRLLELLRELDAHTIK